MSRKIGWIGIFFGLFVAPPQLIKILTTGGTNDISVWTYSFLILAMSCYLYEAIRIKSKVFITAQAVNLTVNLIILGYLIWR